MADFIIPKGKEFKFTIKVIEKDSFIAQDLANMDTANSTFQLILASNATPVPAVTGSPITMVRVPDEGSNPATYLNGIILVTMPALYTTTLGYERGDKVDDYYLKPVYQGIATVKFTDDTGDMTAIIDKVYVAPTGA